MTNSIDNLHGFYEPAPTTWMPQTVGWYCMFAVVAIASIWILVCGIRRWLFNRYRREALKELETLMVMDFSVLLKRTALSVWPRERVASLSGAEWLQFLDEKLRGGGFLIAPGNQIEDLMFSEADLSVEDEKQLRELTAKWIRSHRVRA